MNTAIFKNLNSVAKLFFSIFSVYVNMYGYVIMYTYINVHTYMAMVVMYSSKIYGVIAS